jgi:signal transduction histidine kinase
VQGSFAGATDSQQLALLNIVAEALSNVRRHAGASSVTVTVLAQEGAIEATVSDDGSGFDATSRPSRALREGRAGLVAMSERARLLGGRCTIESRRGGPTAVRVVLPRWRAASGGGGKSSRLRRRLR